MRSMSARVRLLSAVAIVVLGAVGYALFGSVTAIDGDRMARLVLSSPRIAQFKSQPFESTFEPPTGSGSSVVRRAGTSSPTETGIYQVAWRGRSKTSETGFVVELLPSSALARSARNQLVYQYSNPKKLTAETLTLTGKFTVAGLPDAFGATYTQKSSSTSSASSSKIYIVLFQVNRVAAFELTESSDSAINEHVAGSTAVSEARLLGQAEPGFVLTHEVRPVLRAVLFALVTLGLAGGILAVPRIRQFMTQRRERQEERTRLRAQRHVRSRGSKVMQRQRVPYWQQRQTTGRRRSGG
jgi:hypothetical protein